jgi:hypothetical protein
MICFSIFCIKGNITVLSGLGQIYDVESMHVTMIGIGYTYTLLEK